MDHSVPSDLALMLAQLRAEALRRMNTNIFGPAAPVAPVSPDNARRQRRARLLRLVAVRDDPADSWTMLALCLRYGYHR